MGVGVGEAVGVGVGLGEGVGDGVGEIVGDASGEGGGRSGFLHRLGRRVREYRFLGRRSASGQQPRQQQGKHGGPEKMAFHK